MTLVHDTPRLTDEARPFWESAARGRLRLPRCADCQAWVWFPRAACPICGGAVRWEPIQGYGVLTSFAVERRATDPRWRAHTPYVIGHVTLDEGIVLLTNVVNADLALLKTGVRVRVRYEPTTEPDVAVPVFEPVPDGGGNSLGGNDGGESDGDLNGEAGPDDEKVSDA